MSNGSGVQANPAEIRRFQRALSQFNGDITTSTSRIRAQLNTLGSTWRDSEYVKFSQELEVVIQSFERYLQNSDGYLRHLDSKASTLERFLGQG